MCTEHAMDDAFHLIRGKKSKSNETDHLHSEHMHETHNGRSMITLHVQSKEFNGKLVRSAKRSHTHAKGAKRMQCAKGAWSRPVQRPSPCAPTPLLPPSRRDTYCTPSHHINMHAYGIRAPPHTHASKEGAHSRRKKDM
jgi:hypothetical protein